MDGSDVFMSALTQATAVIAQVREDHFANTTPDTEWNVRDLIGHMLYEIRWAPEVLNGKTIDEVGDAYDGDLVGDSTVNLITNWQMAADAAESAVDQSDPEETAHLSYGDVTIDEYLQQYGGDVLIHTWDLGKAIGVVVHFDDATAQAVYDYTLPKKDDLSASGLFEPALSVSETADIQTKLLALFGRDAGWQPSA
jgi:uncharacterized protein (TIGR03086 family)